MNFPRKDSFAFKDFYQKLRFYFLGIADFEGKNKMPSNINIKKHNKHLRRKRYQLGFNNSFWVGKSSEN